MGRQDGWNLSLYHNRLNCDGYHSESRLRMRIYCVSMDEDPKLKEAIDRIEAAS